MTLRPFVAPSLFALAALAACATEEGAPGGAPPDASQSSGFSFECPTRTAAWQNPSPGKPCRRAPDANADGGAWVEEPAFDAGDPTATLYCKYTWNKPDQKPDFDELRKGLNPDNVPALEPERDCPAVGVHGPVVDAPSDLPEVWKPLNEHALRHAGRSPAPLPAPKSQVRVAVIDTSKLAYEAPAPALYDAADEHGRLVGRVIGDLACPGAFSPGAGCAAQIKNYPALTRKDENSAPTWQSGPPDGGYYGSLLELAEAVERALADWNTARAKGGPPRLVINLSVGWSPLFGGQLITKPGQPVDLTKLPKPARPVYAALARASCAGALVVAAAGNRDLASGTGMVYPAAWEALPAPGPEACRSYPLPSASTAPQLPVFPPTGTVAYRPLVHAVGALDALDQPAGITRQGGRPRLAAYGVGVVAYEPRTGGPTRIKTGTSLSAAVASGAAALAWAYDPSLRADEIVNVLFKTGQPVASSVELKPDLCAGQDCTSSIRRVSACNAAAKIVCGNSSCGAAFPCKTVPAFGGELPSPLVDWSAGGFPTLELTAPAGPCTSAADPGCGWVWGGDTSQAEPWVGPQPGGGGCDTCVYSGTESKIVMGLDEYARKCAYAMSTTVALTDGSTQIYTVSEPVSALAAAPGALSTLTAATPPPFEKGLFAMRLPVDPNLVRSVTVWFHTEDGQHPGGAYTRAEGIPLVR